MRIGINAQLLSFEAGYRQAGVALYIAALLRELPSLLDPSDELIAYTGPLSKAAREQFDPSIDWITSSLPTNRPPARILWEQTAGALTGNRQQLDLLHAPVNVIPIASRTPAVVTVHDLAFEHFPDQYPAAKRRYLQVMTRLSVKRARRVIAVSAATARDLTERYRVPPECIDIVPNGVDDRFQPQGAEADAEFRRRNDLPESFLLFVGTLQPRKNLDGLLRAYARIQEQVDWPLVVIGGRGWLEDEIFRIYRRHNLEERVRFAGYVPAEELPDWYSAASGFVLPSHYEGFGLPALEAMACGTPVVVSNSSSLPEVVGDAGLLVDPTELRSIAAGILRLVQDAGLRQELVESGLERARSFHWRRTARETLAAYRRAIAQ